MRQIMTDFLTVLVTISMLGVACAGSVGAPDYTDDARYKSFRGRLYVDAVGMDAAIHPPDGDIIRLKCVEVFDGWNFGQGILDGDKKDARRGKDFFDVHVHQKERKRSQGMPVGCGGR